MEFIDQPQPKHLAIVSPKVAIKAARFQATDFKEWERFDQVFPFNPERVLDFAHRFQTKLSAQRNVTPKDKTDLVFNELIPRCFDAKAAEDWTSTLHFKIDGSGDYTVEVRNGEASVHEGLSGDPTCVITTDHETFAAVLRYEILKDAEQLDDVGYKELEGLDVELSDEELEMAAGGVTVCGGDTCGGAVCGGQAVGSGVTGGGACGGDACGGVGCGIAVCGGDGDGIAACGEDIVGVGVCGADGAVSGICAAEACGIAGCVWDFAIVDACSVDGCILDVIPIIPGI